MTGVAAIRPWCEADGLSDEALARAARGGDREAFARLVDRYRDTAVAYAFARLHSRDEAEDAAQEAFVRAWVALDRFRPSEVWGAWLMSIVRNHCADLLRRRRARPALPLDFDLPGGAPSPEALALSGERRAELHRAVAALPEAFQIPLRMHYGCGRTYREIALALGVPESTVVGRMAGALRTLRRRLGGRET